MGRLFKSYLFKLRYDLAFRITLIIGGGIAVLLTLIYLGIGALADETVISGELMLTSSLSPIQNFGLAVPVNLITFTVLEFTHGAIRNKVIAGHSKGRIYTSLFLNGSFFTLTLMTLYVLLCFALGSIFGGFSVTGNGAYDEHYIVRMVISAVFIYISITSFTIFFATLFRNIGPTIPVVIVALITLGLIGTITSLIPDNEGVVWTMRFVDPLYSIGTMEYASDKSFMRVLTTETFVSGIISNIVYTGLFFTGGLLIFRKRDVK